MGQLMKQMGIAQVDIEAVEVIIRTQDKDIIFDHPQVAKVNMMGQNTYQIVGEAIERERKSATISISQEDINTVTEQTGVSKEEAEKALKSVEGDLAKAILELNR